jgi:DHA3 family macrolide efflux protein-like MFS transporter
MANRPALRGMRTFFIVWAGQLVSTMGSGLTAFALGVWIYQKTGSTTLFALNMLAVTVPNLLISPLAGSLADRWDRRLVMMLSDTGAGLSTLMVALLSFSGRLEVWHVYLATALNAAFTTFQWPAYSAATTLLVPKAQLGRAGGMVQIGEAVSQLVSPVVAGALLVTAGLKGVVLVDFATYFFAILTMLAVRFPKPPATAEGLAARGSVLKDALFGWRYINARRGLLGLLIVFAISNFLFGFLNPVIFPMVLELTTPEILGLLASIVGLGMLLGTLVMSAWGGPKRRIRGVLDYMAISGIFIMLYGLRPSLPLMAIGGFGIMFTMPIISASSQALWQSKVAPDLQGRVFAVRRMIAWSTLPLAYVLAGPLADRVFEPLMAPGGTLAGSLGRVIGVGPGRGMALMCVLIGLISIFTSLGGYLSPRVRRVEDELPDAIPDEYIPAEPGHNLVGPGPVPDEEVAADLVGEGQPAPAD